MKAAVIGAKLDDRSLNETKEIKKVLEENGIKVDFSYFSSSTDEDASELQNSYKRNQKLIKDADFLVAEATDYSSGIGYLIAEALNMKKPVLALHNKQRNPNPSNIIKASANTKHLTFSEYTSPQELKEKIKSFNSQLKSLLDTKFILIISPEIERYLEWASDFRRMHKAQIVRQAVEEMMEKDKEYKEFMKS